MAGLGVTEIVDHYDHLIRGLEQPPIIIGHSFGGLVTQILLDRGLGAAGVAIAPTPVKGTFVEQTHWTVGQEEWEDMLIDTPAMLDRLSMPGQGGAVMCGCRARVVDFTPGVDLLPARLYYARCGMGCAGDARCSSLGEN